jgi:multidrug efflux system membrane fusion protein
MARTVPLGRPLRGPTLLAAACLLPAALGCGHGPEQAAPTGPPAVPVSRPVRRGVTESVEYTGRTDAVNFVNVRARVTGYLVEMPFTEGARVKKGDLLFEIDPRPYQALVDQADGQVKLNQARLRLAATTLERDQAISRASPGAVSQQLLDQDRASVQEAQASIAAAQATLAAYKLNLSFCRVTSPIDGRVSRYYLTLGNLVNQDQTLLTTVVSDDPMYVYFDMDERTVLRVREAVNRGEMEAGPRRWWSPAVELPVFMGLENEEGFPHRGTINFVDNAVNLSTATLTVRGVFDNPLPPRGRRLMSPGMFARVWLPVSRPHPAVLVIDRAIGTDQGLKFVYVVGKDGKVAYRRVTTGALQEDGLRVVEGVGPDELVVVGGLQQVRPGMEVRPDETPMPTIDPPEQTRRQGDKETRGQGQKTR